MSGSSCGGAYERAAGLTAAQIAEVILSTDRAVFRDRLSWRTSHDYFVLDRAIPIDREEHILHEVSAR